jgi:hypothetical protein
MTFINGKRIEYGWVNKLLKKDSFAGIKNGEIVWIAYDKRFNDDCGFYRINFEKNKKDIEFSISKPNGNYPQHVERLNIKQINHIYTKDYLKKIDERDVD